MATVEMQGREVLCRVDGIEQSDLEALRVNIKSIGSPKFSDVWRQVLATVFCCQNTLICSKHLNT